MIFRPILRRLTNVSVKVEGQTKTHILCSTIFFSKNRSVYQITWKKYGIASGKKKHGTARQATDDNIIWGMRTACWITKATDTHTDYVTLTAFPRQKWLQERASVLLLHVRCLSCWTFVTFPKGRMVMRGKTTPLTWALMKNTLVSSKV